MEKNDKQKNKEPGGKKWENSKILLALFTKILQEDALDIKPPNSMEIRTRLVTMKVAGAQMMINKDNCKKQNPHDLQERQEETNHTQTVWNSTLQEMLKNTQGWKILNARNLKSRVHVLFFWFIVCRL